MRAWTLWIFRVIVAPERPVGGSSTPGRHSLASTVAAAPQRAMWHFRLLVLGNTISSYGNFLNMVALNLYAYAVTGSALQTGLFMALRLASGSAAGLIAGRLTDRFSYKAVMLGANIASAAAMTAMVLVPAGWSRPALFGLALVTGACGTFFAVSLRSAIPVIVGVEQRQRANGLVVTGRALSMVAGFASAGVVVALFDYRAAFLVDAATFAVSALTVAVLPIRAERRPEGSPAAKPEPFRLALLGPAVLSLIFLHAIMGVGSGSFHVTLPVYSNLADPSDPAGFMSAFWTAWAIGNILAHQVLQRLAKRLAPTGGTRLYLGGVFVMSLTSILAYAALPLPATLMIAGVTGLGSGLAEIAFAGRLQLLDEPARSRAFGLSISTESVGFGAGTMAGAFLLEGLHPLTVLATLTLGGGVVAALFALITMSRPTRTETVS